MSALTRFLFFSLVVITVTIITNAEPDPVPIAVITKKDAMNFIKKQIKNNIYEPAKKQVMPIIKTITDTFAEGLKNATSTAILKGRDAFVHMKHISEAKKEDTDRDTIPFDSSYD